MNMHTTAAERREMNSGVCLHSQDSYWDEYVIFCVGNDIMKEQAFMSWAVNHGIGYKVMLGRYNGVTERSFMVNMNDIYKCWHWFEDEESILVLGRHEPFRYGMRPAKLVYLKDGAWGNEEDLGFMHAVSYEEAMQEPAFTLDLVGGQFWIARPKDARTPRRNRGLA